MPSTKYTRIEITPEAYRALEAEAILQEKTLKKLASELILRGISKEALDFIKKAGESKKIAGHWTAAPWRGLLRRSGPPG